MRVIPSINSIYSLCNELLSIPFTHDDLNSILLHCLNFELCFFTLNHKGEGEVRRAAEKIGSKGKSTIKLKTVAQLKYGSVIDGGGPVCVF